MAQDSMPWDGTTVGHALSTDVWSAPYNSAEWADAHSKIWQSNVAKGYVLPAYGNNLVVTANSPVALNVLAGTGAIMIRGRVYENTAQQTLTVTAADATNPRIDRVVARITFASQTIELAVLAGTPAATPALPTLTQNATTYEISLFYIWVAATVTSIAETEIHDERVFATNLENLLSALLQDNLIVNSEFMGFSRLNTIGASAGAPDRWTVVGTVTTWASATKPTQMSRGRAVSITAGAATSGMSQTLRAKASTVYAIRTLINVTAGDVGVVSVTDNGASPATISRNVRRTGSFIEELILYTTPADATTITVSLLANANTDVVQFGQTLVCEGYQTGPFRQVHETIIFDWSIADPDFYSDTFVGNGTTTINLNTDYEGLVLPGTQALYLVAVLVSTNPAGSTTVEITRVVGNTMWLLQIAGGAANLGYYLTGWVAIESHSSAFAISRVVTAGTSTISVIIEGIRT